MSSDVETMGSVPATGRFSTDRTGPPRAYGSALSLVWACAGFFLAGAVLGTIAMVTALEAKKAQAADPNLAGRELANLGYWFGAAAIAQHVLRIIWRLS